MSNIFEHNKGFAYKAAHAGEQQNGRASFIVRQSQERSSASYRHEAGQALPIKELVSNKLLTALPGEDFARLVPFLEPVFLSSRENLNEAGEPSGFVYFPENAVLSCLSGFQDGHTAEVSLIGKEGIVGLAAILGSNSAMQWTKTLVAGSALRMKAEILKQEFDRGGMLRELLLNYTSEYIVQVTQRAICNIRHRVEERLANWLLMVCDRLDADELPLTQEVIAQHLGTRRAGITTAAKELENRQLISHSRGHIRIVDRQALEGAACECYGVLKYA